MLPYVTLPCMRYTNNMPNIAQAELQQLIRHNTSCIAEAEQTVICKDGTKTHRPSMQQALMAQVAETTMTVHDLDSLSYEDLPQHWERREYRWKGRAAVNDPMWQMVDFDAVGQVAYPGTRWVVVGWRAICVGDDYHIVATVDEFLLILSA
jgi:hypothetical protein